jgi:hypothetical protein
VTGFKTLGAGFIGAAFLGAGFLEAGLRAAIFFLAFAGFRAPLLFFARVARFGTALLFALFIFLGLISLPPQGIVAHRKESARRQILSSI